MKMLLLLLMQINIGVEQALLQFFDLTLLNMQNVVLSIQASDIVFEQLKKKSNYLKLFQTFKSLKAKLRKIIIRYFFGDRAFYICIELCLFELVLFLRSDRVYYVLLNEKKKHIEVNQPRKRNHASNKPSSFVISLRLCPIARESYPLFPHYFQYSPISYSNFRFVRSICR